MNNNESEVNSHNSAADVNSDMEALGNQFSQTHLVDKRLPQSHRSMIQATRSVSMNSSVLTHNSSTERMAVSQTAPVLSNAKSSEKKIPNPSYHFHPTSIPPKVNCGTVMPHMFNIGDSTDSSRFYLPYPVGHNYFPYRMPPFVTYYSQKNKNSSSQHPPNMNQRSISVAYVGGDGQHNNHSHVPFLPHQISDPSFSVMPVNSPTADRRKSVPVSSNDKCIPKSFSVTSMISPTPIHEMKNFKNKEKNPNKPQSSNEFDDEDYTRALLQHQHDSLHRLQVEYEAKENELAELQTLIINLGKRVNQNLRPSNRPTLQEIDKLREKNKQLKIDCHCMTKELDLFLKGGDNTRDSFYTRYNEPSARKVPSRSEDEGKWRCHHCTFDNHAALNKCEICEFSRDSPPDNRVT